VTEAHAGVAMAAVNAQGGDMSSQVRSDLTSIDSVVGASADFGEPLAGVTGGRLAVNHDNVLQAGKIIQDQVDHLNDVVRMKLRALHLDKFAEDDVSLDAVASWNRLLVDNDDSYAHRIQQYVDSLGQLADQLKIAAKLYGYTEDQIKESFGAL